jgi:hypothetical protein
MSCAMPAPGTTMAYQTMKGAGMIAVFGAGPVDIRLADPAKPSWRQI